LVFLFLFYFYINFDFYNVIVSFFCAGYYFTGDGAKRDDDGYYWITGRVDDVINPSGHRIGKDYKL
jgi:acetyl-CoA synthetase